MTNKISNNLSEIQAQWVTVRSKIRQKIGDAQFASWIKLLTLEDYSDQKVTLSVPSNFIRTRIIEQYLDIIKSYWYVQNLRINDIKIIVIEKNKLKLDDIHEHQDLLSRIVSQYHASPSYQPLHWNYFLSLTNLKSHL